MARSIGYVMALGAGAILLGLAFAVPQAFAVDGGGDSGDTKAGKSCPSGQRFSEKKHGCVRTSCGTGQVWSSGVDEAIAAHVTGESIVGW